MVSKNNNALFMILRYGKLVVDRFKPLIFLVVLIFQFHIIT